jgi:hypothetical protein
MIPVEAEDIPLVKQIAQVPRRVLHRPERHADQPSSANLEKAQAEGLELSTVATASNQ